MKSIFQNGVLFFCAFLISSSTLYAEPVIHQVRSGETLWSISRQYSVPVKEIMRTNRLRNPRRLEVGQRLVIPEKGTPVTRRLIPKTDTRETLLLEEPRVIDKPYEPLQGDLSPVEFQALNRLCRTNSGKLFSWKYIVIHHSATPNGGARAFDHFHRAKRRMQNGLAYHFVIGNGNGARDGQIEVGTRWKKQIRGGHCSNQEMNEVGLGICLVGNFEVTRPTRRQMHALVTLTQYLQNLCEIPDSHVILHREVKQKSTLCPGRKFPADDLRRQL